MIGDRLIIKEHHRYIAEEIVNAIEPALSEASRKELKYIISVAGESGSGKSETGLEIRKSLINRKIKTYVFCQDDYYVFPPKTNHAMRLSNIEQVGPYEVKLDLIEANLFSFKSGQKQIYKPLIDYNANTINHETIDVGLLDVIVVEGTYTSLLEFADCRVFINRTFKQTRKDRIERGREKNDPFIERALESEHKIIRSHKKLADIIIKQDFSGIEVRQAKTGMSNG